MRQNTEDVEFRDFLGLDERADTYRVSQNYQTHAKNLVLQKGVLKCRPGYSQWGSLDHRAISGQLFKCKGFDVGDDEYVLLHKGSALYYGNKTDSSFTQLQDRSGTNISVSAEESDFELMGKAVGEPDAGNAKTYTIKILFKQEDGCKILEWDGTTWYGRDPGLDVSAADFTVGAAAGGNAEAGLYRCRLVAMRIENGVRIIESLHTGGSANSKRYREVTLDASNASISFQVTHSGASSLITHYMLQITRVLDMVGDSAWSKSGNDPAVFFETDPIAAATAIAGTTITVDEDSLNSTAFNFYGHETIPGHLISVISGGIVFIAGVGTYPNRVYRAGDSGHYYHNETYDTFQYYPAGEEDGQDVTGLGVCQDHLVIFKEASTGIVPNRDPAAQVTWRDKKLGALNRKAFDNISEDQMIVHNQDGIFRIFNAIEYDRQAEVEGASHPFSENIRTTSEGLDPSTLEYIFHREKLYIMYGDWGEREAVVLHPRDGMAWSNWQDLYHRNNFLMGNGLEWVFEKGGVFFEQSAASLVYADNGDDIWWEVHFAPLFNLKSRREKIIVKVVGIEGEFTGELFSRYIIDGGRIDTDWSECYPDPTNGDGNVLMRKAAHGSHAVVGQSVELYLRGLGECTIRGIHWVVIRKQSGGMGWSVQTGYTAADYAEVLPLDLDAGTDARDDSEYEEYDAESDPRTYSQFTEYVRPS